RNPVALRFPGVYRIVLYQAGGGRIRSVRHLQSITALSVILSMHSRKRLSVMSEMDYVANGCRPLPWPGRGWPATGAFTTRRAPGEGSVARGGRIREDGSATPLLRHVPAVH